MVQDLAAQVQNRVPVPEDDMVPVPAGNKVVWECMVDTSEDDLVPVGHKAVEVYQDDRTGHCRLVSDTRWWTFFILSTRLRYTD